MVDEAHGLGVKVKPWTVNRLNIVEQLLDWDVDGVISDCMCLIGMVLFAFTNCS